jgi:hypothetical protein
MIGRRSLVYSRGIRIYQVGIPKQPSKYMRLWRFPECKLSIRNQGKIFYVKPGWGHKSMPDSIIADNRNAKNFSELMKSRKA